MKKSNMHSSSPWLFKSFLTKGRRRGVELAPSETLVAIIIGICVVFLILAVIVTIYNAIFGSSDDRLAKVQFENINTKITNLLNDPSDFNWDFTILQNPSSGYYIIGYDAGDTSVMPTLPLPQPSNPSKKTIDRPASECGDRLNSCLCLYDSAVINQLYQSSGTTPPNPKPLACHTYPQDVLFVSSTTIKGFAGWGDKSIASSTFKDLNPFNDPRLQSTVPYYAVFVVSNDKMTALNLVYKDPSARYLYIEKSTAWKKDPTNPDNNKKWTIIMVADYDDNVRQRQDALQLCPEGDPTSTCSYAHQGGLLSDPSCDTKQGVCSLSQGTCIESCVPHCLASNTPNQRVIISSPCACEGLPETPLPGNVRISGSCATDDRGTEYYISGRCLGTGYGTIYATCACRSDSDVHNDGQCFMKDDSGKETWSYCTQETATTKSVCSAYVEYISSAPSPGFVGPPAPT